VRIFKVFHLMDYYGLRQKCNRNSFLGLGLVDYHDQRHTVFNGVREMIMWCTHTLSEKVPFEWTYCSTAPPSDSGFTSNIKKVTTTLVSEIRKGQKIVL
jgi:hypothetical protein